MIKILLKKRYNLQCVYSLCAYRLYNTYLVVLDKEESGKGKPAGSTVCKQKTSILIDWHIVVHLRSFNPMLIN